MGTIVIPLSNQCLTDGGKVSTGIPFHDGLHVPHSGRKIARPPGPYVWDEQAVEITKRRDAHMTQVHLLSGSIGHRLTPSGDFQKTSTTDDTDTWTGFTMCLTKVNGGPKSSHLVEERTRAAALPMIFQSHSTGLT